MCVKALFTPLLFQQQAGIGYVNDVASLDFMRLFNLQLALVAFVRLLDACAVFGMNILDEPVPGRLVQNRMLLADQGSVFRVRQVDVDLVLRRAFADHKGCLPLDEPLLHALSLFI